MVAKATVIVALTPWLGQRLIRMLDESVERITHWLNAWSEKQELDELRRKINSLLFLSVRQATEGRLVIPLDDGSCVRVRLEDFEIMADDVMYTLFAQFPPDAAHLLTVREFSMRQESLAALRALYTRFGELQSRQELDTIASFIRKSYPAYRWRSWLMG